MRPPDDARSSHQEQDLERATENVLDGWPTSPPAPTEDDEPSDEPAFADEAVADEVEDDAFPLADEEEPEALTSTVVEEPPVGEVIETSSEHAPGQLAIPPGYAVLEGQPQGRRRAVGIVVSRFNGEVTGGLLTSALDELAERGVGPDSITVMPVPGAFELPIAAMALAKTRRFACIVALGCVIRGDTPHFDYVASEAASGLQLAAIETGVPVAFGVLTLDRPDQAEPRYAKGAEAVVTALEMADLFANLRAAAAR
jgi:6,7-dimethyl-8-ribityllumazine synthase